MPADKTALQDSYDAAAEKLADKDAYTADSFAALESALAAAEDVLNDPAAEQSAADAAKDAVDAAVEGLIARADGETLGQLQAAAEELRTLGETATEEQFASAKEILERADALLAQGAENISAEEADTMITDLQSAIDAVKKAMEDSGDDGDDGENPGENPGGNTGDQTGDGSGAGTGGGNGTGAQVPGTDSGKNLAAAATGDAAPIMLYVLLAAGTAVIAVLAGRFRRVR